jgi:hypothetical protein
VRKRASHPHHGWLGEQLRGCRRPTPPPGAGLRGELGLGFGGGLLRRLMGHQVASRVKRGRLAVRWSHAGRATAAPPCPRPAPFAELLARNSLTRTREALHMSRTPERDSDQRGLPVGS